METASSINRERGKFREATVDLIAGSLGNLLSIYIIYPFLNSIKLY